MLTTVYLTFLDRWLQRRLLLMARGVIAVSRLEERERQGGIEGVYFATGATGAKSLPHGVKRRSQHSSMVCSSRCDDQPPTHHCLAVMATAPDCSTRQMQAWSVTQQVLHSHLVGSTAGGALGLLGGTGCGADSLVSSALGLARHIIGSALGLACQLLGAGQLAQVGGRVLCLQWVWPE